MKHQSVTKTKYWHNFLPTVLVHFKIWTVLKWRHQAGRFYILCVFDHLDAPEAQSVLCLSVLERAAHTHTHTLQPGEQRLSCGLYFQHFIKNVQQFINCKDDILQQSADDWSDSDVNFWSGRNECAPLWKEGSYARRNAAIILRSQNKILKLFILFGFGQEC